MQYSILTYNCSCFYLKDFGPKVNFKRQRVQMGNFTGLPGYSKFIVDRLNEHLDTKFDPVELCNLDYDPDRGACIDAHLDDSWLWGDRLITLNLASPTYLTFTLPANFQSNDFEHLRAFLPKNDSDPKVI